MNRLVLIVLSSLLCSISSLHFSLSPPDNAFFLHSHSFASTNFTNRVLYLQGDCPSSTDQRLTVSSGNRAESSRLFSSLPNLHCAVSVKLVHDAVKLDRPYVDVLAVADTALLAFLKQTACVTVQITSPTAETVSSTCHLSPFEESKHNCLLRTQIPHKWFGSVGHNSTRQTLSMSYTVSATCNVPFYDRPQTPISILPFIESAQAHTLSRHDDIDLSLLSRANISFNLKSLNSLFVHLSYNSTEDFGSVEIRLFIDSRIEIVAVNPLSPEEWIVRVQSAQRPEVYTSFSCIPKNKVKSWDGYVFSLLVKMKGNLLENKRLEKGEEGAEVTLHWEIRRRTAENHTKDVVDRVATKFRVTPDVVYALVPVSKSTDIINTGILSGRQSSTTMRVYTVSLGGTVKDVTANSHCISAESKVLKTSPTCTTVYVDGSEMRGTSNIEIHVSFDKWTTSISFTVWFPRLPVTLWLKDPVLNSIKGWPIAKWKDLKEGRHRRAAKQFSCSTRFQQSEVTVLASFQVSDEKTGERIFLSGNKDVHFDVTSIAADSILSLDRHVAIVRNFNNRVVIQATAAGSTRIVLKRSGPSVDYGGATVVVTDDPVTVSRLTAVPIVEMNINLEMNAGKRAQYTATADIETIFTQRYQHGSFFYQLQYSDDSTEPLDDVTSTDYTLTAVSTDERVVALSHKGRNMVETIALDDLTDPAVEFELRAPAHCIESDSLPLASALVPIHLQFSDNDSSRLAAAKAYASSNDTASPTAALPPEPQSRSDLLIFFVILLCIVIVIKLFYNRARNFNGYEKLVVPLLSRLSSSSSSGGADENTKEWVWLSKSRIDTNSIGSRYSQKSTMNLPEQSSPSYDDNTHTSISYRGSEISVFISPTPVVTVNAERERGAGGSWRSGGRSRTRAARHALVDSSSDHNLARVVARTGSWRDENTWQNHTWNAKRRNLPSDVYDGMRESIA